MARTHASISSDPLVIQRVRPQQSGRLELTSAALDDQGRIGDVYTCLRNNLSPPLDWTAMPEAETFALVVQDPDSCTTPALHWIVWNIPGRMSGLPQDLRHGPVLGEFGGMVQGCNAHGEFGYMGPRPPAGGGPHRYHFQLFALDLKLNLAPTAGLEPLVNILKAHAIASAELVGTYENGAEPRSFARAEADTGRGGLDEDDVDRHAPHDPQGTVR